MPGFKRTVSHAGQVGRGIRGRWAGLISRAAVAAVMVWALLPAGCNKDADQGDANESGPAATARPAAGDKSVDLSKPFAVPSPDLSKLRPVMRETLEAALAAARQNPADTAKLAEAGMLLYVFQYPAEAAPCFAEAAKREAEELRWPYYLGLSLQASGARAQAAKAFESALAINPEYSAAETRLGEMLLDSDPNRAAARFEKALQIEIGSARAQYGLGLCALKAGDKTKAGERFRQALTIQPDYREVHAEVAELVRAEGDTAKAEEHLSASVNGRTPGYANDPLADDLMRKGRTAAILTEVASDQFEAGELSDALNSLVLATRLDPKHAPTWRMLGRVWAEMADLGSAESAYRRALEQAPNDAETKAMLADCLGSQRRLDEAMSLFDEAVATDPDHPGVLWRKGRVLRIQGKADEGFELVKRAVELAPADPDARMVYADFLYFKGDRNAALQQVDALLKLAPRAWRGYHLKGGIHLELGDKEAARAAWRKLVELVPAFVPGYMQLVGLALSAGDAAQAEEHLRRGLVHVPNSALLCNALAWRLAAAADAERRKPNEALRYADRACKLTERNPEAIYLDTLAVVYAQLGRFEDAVNIERQAVDLARQQGSPELAEYEARLKMFENKEAYVDKF